LAKLKIAFFETSGAALGNTASQGNQVETIGDTSRLEIHLGGDILRAVMVGTMRKTLLLSLVLAAATGGTVALPRESSAAAAQVPGKQTLSYGTAPAQRLEYWPGASAHAPLVVFVHGGGWKAGDMTMMDGSAKLAHWHALGYAVASIDYRLVPQATVEDEAADVAEAVGFLRGNAQALGFDANRIALVGHSAGAHLVALVGTDPRWLNGAGLNIDDVRGIVALDGAAYDVARQLSIGAPLMQRTYVQAFGTDPARQKGLSPTMQAAKPNAPAFLILHVQRPDGVAQSEALAAALRKAGTPVEIEGFPDTGLAGHAAINRRLGEADYPATAVLDRWLARHFR
jgi:acetyl esterase/lipase